MKDHQFNWLRVETTCIDGYTGYTPFTGHGPKLETSSHHFTANLTCRKRKKHVQWFQWDIARCSSMQNANTQNQPRNQPFTTLRPLLKQQNKILPTNMVISSEKWTVHHLTNKEPVYLKQTIPSSSTNVGKTWSKLGQNLAPPNEDFDHVRILKTGMSGCHMISDWEVH